MDVYSYRSAVFNHGVLHLVTLGNATREEAALANVVVKMFQAPISGERKKRRRWSRRETGEKRKGKKVGESIEEGNLQLCFLRGRSS